MSVVMSTATVQLAGPPRHQAQPLGGRRVGARARPRSVPVRLTGRGRVAAVVLLVVLPLAAATTGWGRPPTVLGGTQRPAVSRVVTVAPGDTLWAIARRAAPRRDVRDTVRRIIEVNRLEGAVVRPGQQLAVPSPP